MSDIMVTKPEQIPFDLPARPAFSRDDFFVSTSNANAIAALDLWPNWPGNVLVLHGAAGCGKTHLCHVHAVRSGARLTDVPDLFGATEIVIDNADRLCGDAVAEEMLFHTLNRLAESGGHVLMTGATPPAGWPFILPDLRSRVLAAHAVAVEPPDDVLITVLLAKLFSDRQLFVTQDVIQFILARCERSFAAISALVADIDRRALAEKRAVTIPLVRDIFQQGLL